MSFDERFDAYLKHAREQILLHGWIVQGVFPTENHPCTSFAYTIGLWPSGVPELIISGLPPKLAQWTLNELAPLHMERDGFKPGDRIPDVVSVTLIVIEAPDAPIQQARNHFGPRVKALQLVWPDDKGRYLGEEGCSTRPESQELFGLPTYLGAS